MNYTPSPPPRGRLIQRDARRFPDVLPPNPLVGPAGTGMDGKPGGLPQGMPDLPSIKAPRG